ncbi:MAG: dihydrolipoyl dehydrogenase [Candidatus Micrarchaeia archaeon]
MEKFDLIVIGGGSGLDVVSAAAAKGMRVALIEEGPMGGTCLNRGCIPSKILIHAADVMQEIKKAPEFGITVGKVSVDFGKVMSRARVVDEDARGIEESIRRSKNITLFKERGRFVGPKTLRVGDKEISSDRIVIAAGTRPAVPTVEGLASVPYMTSDDALRLDHLPERLIIIGGGYISCELAHFFSSMGSKVVILQRNVRLLPDEDEEVSLKFTELFSKQCEVHLKFALKRVEKKGGNIVAWDAEGKSLEGTDLLVATGRVPNSDILEVSKAGIKTDKHGYIESGGFMETNVPGVYVLGDIAGKYLFKHSANLEAEYVAHNILEPQKRIEVDYTAMPHAVFSHPQVAGVGATEQQLKEGGHDYLVGRYMYSGTGMGEALAEKDGFVKFLTDYQGKILGCHIMGPEASSLIHEVLVSMKAGRCHVNDIINTVHIHPALSEVVQRGAGSV